MSLKWSLVWAEVWGSHGGFLLVGRVTTEPGRWWFPRIQPFWLSLSCVCLCFPSTEPGIFPLIIFSPGTLDHPGIQSWTQISETVWRTPGFALRYVSFWRWFQRWDLLPSETWPSQVAWLLLPLSVSPLSPSAHLPPHPSSQHPSVCPSSYHPCFSPLTGSHCPWVTVPCRLLSL